MYGYLSGQVDPRDCYNADRMLKQALDIAQISPNIMVKVPGTREGYEVIEKLTARGIATNNTLVFHRSPVFGLHGGGSKGAGARPRKMGSIYPGGGR